ncbi:MAG: translation elongation factor-like protein [Actinobacteria bacterium]|nr:MAG: translation elongation factor-like protein [Actinomycetota bacterium]
MEQEIGKVTHYFGKIGIAIIKLSGKLKIGDRIHFKGHTSDWEQSVDSMQSEHEAIEDAGKGDVVGINSKDHAREGDVVYLVTEE